MSTRSRDRLAWGCRGWTASVIAALLVPGCGEPAGSESTMVDVQADGDDSGSVTTSGVNATTGDDGGPSDDSGSTSAPDDDDGETDASATTNDDDGPPVIFDVGGANGTSGGRMQDCQGDTTVLQATVRDFGSSHPDFEVFWGGDPTTGLVLSGLGADQTPQFNPSVPTPPATSSPTQITSAQTFAQWFHDVQDINLPVEIDIELAETEPGLFVFDDATFFPLDDAGFNAAPGPNNETFPDSLGDQHNFHFTTEIHTSFEYSPGQIFTFIGDDDLWVFVNGALVIDLGGLHGELEGSVDMDTLGLAQGTTYAMDVFHAERRHDGSHFRIETSIECFLPPAG